MLIAESCKTRRRSMSPPLPVLLHSSLDKEEYEDENLPANTTNPADKNKKIRKVVVEPPTAMPSRSSAFSSTTTTAAADAVQPPHAHNSRTSLVGFRPIPATTSIHLNSSRMDDYTMFRLVPSFCRLTNHGLSIQDEYDEKKNGATTSICTTITGSTGEEWPKPAKSHRGDGTKVMIAVPGVLAEPRSIKVPLVPDKTTMVIPNDWRWASSPSFSFRHNNIFRPITQMMVGSPHRSSCPKEPETTTAATPTSSSVMIPAGRENDRGDLSRQQHCRGIQFLDLNDDNDPDDHGGTTKRSRSSDGGDQDNTTKRRARAIPDLEEECDDNIHTRIRPRVQSGSQRWYRELEQQQEHGLFYSI